SIAVAVEGQMKIGHFTLSFVDLAIPVSGLDIEIVRTYDSRDLQQRDFGVGWSLDVHQGSYRNNRPPGDGWQLQTGFLPCDTVLESKSHLTVVRLSDQEVYRFALRLADGTPTTGGCFATARFDFVDGPLPGTTLEILGQSQVFFENGSDRVLDADTFELYVPEDVRLITRDGRILDLDLNDGVTRLEDLNGNQLSITPTGISHSSGRGIDFERDAEGRIERITDPLDRVMSYSYDDVGDLTGFTDRASAVTRFTYDDHRLRDIEDPRGVKPIRNEYDAEGRLVRHVDAFGKVIELGHDPDNRRDVVTNRLDASRVLEYDDRATVVRET
ncbi:MAG: RHS repeat protein, partial [Actinomycetia bacterium]|nr:RHS repeat protein [Actinomycetes bacterium]